MFIYTRDREIIPKIKPLVVAPNIRKSLYSGRWYVCSINLYCGDKFVADYDSYDDALAEAESIIRCKDNYYFVGGYQGDPKIIQKLEAELRKLMGDT